MRRIGGIQKGLGPGPGLADEIQGVELLHRPVPATTSRTK